jgi:hypothetical protein
MKAFQLEMSRTVAPKGSLLPATWPSVMLTALRPELRASPSARAATPRALPE